MRLIRRTEADARGRSEITPGDPPIEEHRDVYATPHVEFERWGVFDRDDRPVALAVERGGDPLEPLRQIPESTTRWSQVLETAPAGPTYVYAGRQVFHFGHFLLETLARLWPFADGLPDGVTLVMHGDGDPRGWFSIPYVRTLLGALGITPDRILHVERPIRFERLQVAGSAFLPGWSASPAMGRLTRAIGSRLTCGFDPPAANGRPAFFAKTRLVGGVSHLQNEGEIVDALARRGVEIVHPQEMSFLDHVRFLEARRVTSGWLSSAHHVALFASRLGRFPLLAPERPNSNFFLVDKLTGAEAEYWFPEGMHNVPAANTTFLVERVAPDPAALAQALLEKF